MTSDAAADAGQDDYDEFGMLKLYADHEGIPWRGTPVVDRQFVDVYGQRISALVWGSGDPQIVLIHGGAQNAHTWDSVAMALDRPLVAIDLPGHGHSDWRDDHDYRGITNAPAVAAVISELAPNAKLVVGMSLGGLTLISLSAQRPDLVRRAVIVDVTPNAAARVAAMTPAQRGSIALTAGPSEFASFEEMLQATSATVPGRPVETLRPGVRHNARRLPDGRWGWRYDRGLASDGARRDHTSLWADVAAIAAPIMLVRGSRSVHVHDEDVVEFRTHQPSLRVEVVEDAGHSVQSDKPLRLVALVNDFLATKPEPNPEHRNQSGQRKGRG
jgi:pimeloyl-ACP methyl ester carboxylesterase